MSAVEFRIETDRGLSSDQLTELAGFRTEPSAGGAFLQGSVADSAALWGILHRLHRAGVSLRSVERLVPSGCPPAHSPDRTTTQPPGRIVHIEVEGHAAGVIAGSMSCVELYQSPPSTLLMLTVGGEKELFDVLAVLEGLALEVREIHVDR